MNRHNSSYLFSFPRSAWECRSGMLDVLCHCPTRSVSVAFPRGAWERENLYSLGNFNQAKRWYLDALKKGYKDAALGLAKLGLEDKVNFSRAEILEYLQIVIDAEGMVDVCIADQEEAHLLLDQCDSHVIL